MSPKVKRGLGLLVVAVIAFLLLNVTARIGFAAGESGGAGEVVGWLFLAVSLAVVLAMLASAVGGLVLLAWGLLRD